MLRNLLELYKQNGLLQKMWAVVSAIFKLTKSPHEMFLRAKSHMLHDGKFLSYFFTWFYFVLLL